MKAQALIATVALLAAVGSTFAADTSEAAFDQAFRNNTGASTLTREQVKADTIAARKAGLLDTNEVTQDVAYIASHSNKNADVKARLATRQTKDNTAN